MLVNKLDKVLIRVGEFQDKVLEMYNELEEKLAMSEEQASGEALNVDKLRLRLDAAKEAEKSKALELFAGKGQLTKFYKDIFKKTFVVEKDENKARKLEELLGAENVFAGDNQDFLESEIEKHMGFTFVDFDHRGSPAKLIQKFFDKIEGKTQDGFVLALTDGMLTTFRIRGNVNLYQHYLQGEDETTKVTDEMYEKFDDIVDRFIKKVSRRHGFEAEKINGKRNSLGTAYYASYRIS